MGAASQGFGGVGVPGSTLKAWVKLSSTGTNLGGMNVASVAKGASGVYTVTFTSAMTGTDYVCKFTAGRSSGADVPIGKLATASTAAVASLSTALLTAGGVVANDIGGVWEFYE